MIFWQRPLRAQRKDKKQKFNAKDAKGARDAKKIQEMFNNECGGAFGMTNNNLNYPPLAGTPKQAWGLNNGFHNKCGITRGVFGVRRVEIAAWGEGPTLRLNNFGFGPYLLS